MRNRANLDLYNDLRAAVTQALQDTDVIDRDDFTVATMPYADGVPRWVDADAVISAVAARCVTVFDVHGVRPDSVYRMRKDGSRLPPKKLA